MSTVTPPGVFDRVRVFSVSAISVVAGAIIVLGLFDQAGSAEWQVWLAVVALAVGIPHGALDHLVTVPSMQVGKMAAFIAAYLAVVAVATTAILMWPLWGFIGVVAMSAVHFGMGDASFVRQGQQSDINPVPWWVYAVPAGTVPVVIPLTKEGSTEALALVNDDLINWHFGADQVLLWASIASALVAIVWLFASRRVRDAFDITALLVLALVAPPLVAFAAYFGLWHALRHTARLTLEFPKAKVAVSDRKWLKGLWIVTLPGLPSLVGTMLIAAGITWLTDLRIDDYLFVALAIVWALTVPHMALTWRLDREALGIGPVNGARLSVEVASR